MCQTDLKNEAHIQQQALLQGGGGDECVCVCTGARLSQAPDAEGQTGICPVHLPQRLQQRGADTRPPVNTNTQTHTHTEEGHTNTHHAL